MNNIKRTIALVYGGNSSEYSVSLRSAQGINSFIDHDKYDVYTVSIKGLNWNVHLNDGSIVEIDKNDFSFKENGTLKVFDYAYITIHGTPGEDGILQGYFELIGIPYSTCSVLTEALTFNKFVLNQYLKGYGVRVPNSLLITRDQINNCKEEDIEERIGMPCFVKPADNGSSFGVSKVKKADQLAPAIRKAMLETNLVMVEEYLQGTEISIGCFKTKKRSVVLPATEVVTKNEFFDFDAKYNGQVEEITPARINKETAERVAKITSAIYDILKCNGIIRIDYIITKNDKNEDVINMIEVNTTPGMTPTSFIPQQVKAANMDIKDVLTEIIENQF